MGTAFGLQEKGAKSERTRAVIGYVPHCAPSDVSVGLPLVLYSPLTGDIFPTTGSLVCSLFLN